MEPGRRAILERELSVEVVGATRLRGGFSGAQCWTVELAAHGRMFVKLAGDIEGRAANVNEARVLGEVRSRHLPALIGLLDDGSMLVTEDLGSANWPVVPVQIDELWAALEEIGAQRGPTALWQSHQGSGRNTWAPVADDPRLTAAIGLPQQWIDGHIPTLAASSTEADTSGDRLLHGDLAPGNWCRDAGGVWRFVDWASAHRGNPIVDQAIAAVRLTRLSGAPSSSTALMNHPEFVAFVGGRFASELLDVDWSTAPPEARAHRVADIRASLVLAAALLDIPAPVFSPA